MTKRHFEAFANRLRADLTETQRRWPDKYQETLKTVTYAADAFATVAETENSRFDRDRFLKACGLR